MSINTLKRSQSRVKQYQDALQQSENYYTSPVKSSAEKYYDRDSHLSTIKAQSSVKMTASKNYQSVLSPTRNVMSPNSKGDGTAEKFNKLKIRTSKKEASKSIVS